MKKNTEGFYNDNDEIYEEEPLPNDYEHKPLSIRSYGIFLGLLTAVIGLFIVFAWKDEEDRKEFLSGWFLGVIIAICIAVCLVGFISCTIL